VNLRRKFVMTFGAVTLMASFATFAQQKAKAYRIGVLGSGSAPNTLEFINDVQIVLRDLGYRDGKSIVMEYRVADFQLERLPRLAAELVALNPDIIVAGATSGTRAAMQATATIPIIMIGPADPVGSGFVVSLAHPGGNITGLANLGLDMAAKPLEILHRVVPHATRIAVLLTGNPSHPAIAKEIAKAGKTLGLTVILTTATSVAQIDNAFASMEAERAQGLVVVSDALTVTNRKLIADLAANAKLPAIYGTPVQVEAGGLLSYGPSDRNQHKAVAWYIDKIMNGAKPGDLPVQQPTEFELAINLTTAKLLGIAFPQEILLRADQKFE
jgi:putative ABC transport system substrate-binding protein